MTFNLSDTFISYKEEQITLKIKAISQISFNLNSQDLEQIIDYKKDRNRLHLSSKLLTELRYTVLLQSYNNLQFPLSFTTCYVQQQQKVAVIKSVVDLQGKITQYLCRSFLDRPYLLNDLAIAHYWLIEQICDRLPLEYHHKGSLFTTILSLVIVLILAPLLLYFISVNWIIKLLLLVAMFCFLKIIFDFAFKKYLASFIFKQLTFGLLSKNISGKNLGFKLLSYL